VGRVTPFSLSFLCAASTSFELSLPCATSNSFAFSFHCTASTSVFSIRCAASTSSVFSICCAALPDFSVVSAFALSLLLRGQGNQGKPCPRRKLET
jgi:hypothetical protein